MNRKQRTYAILREIGSITPDKLAKDLCCHPASAEVVLHQMLNAGLVMLDCHRKSYELYFRQGQEYIVKPCCGLIDCAHGPTTGLDGAHVNIAETWPPVKKSKVYDSNVTVTRYSASGEIITNRIHISNLHPLPTLLD